MALSGQKFTGKNLSVSIGGTVVDQSVVRSAEIDEAQDMLDSTGAGGGSKTYLPGETGRTATFEFWLSSLNSDLYDLFAATNAGDTGEAYILYPRGNSSGEQSITFYGFASNKRRGIEKNSVVPLTVTVTITGDVTEAVI